MLDVYAVPASGVRAWHSGLEQFEEFGRKRSAGVDES